MKHHAGDMRIVVGVRVIPHDRMPPFQTVYAELVAPTSFWAQQHFGDLMGK